MSAIAAQASGASILDRVPERLLVGGEWREATGGASLGVEDPATGEQLCEVVGAIERGATPLTGGRGIHGAGSFYEPTVLGAMPAGARLLGEEIFGPVAPLVSFSGEDEAIAAANATEYGLVAYVYTRDLDRDLRVIDCLHTGMVGLNRGLVSNPAAPFGGVKASGFEREGGQEGIEEYLGTKSVAIGMEQASRDGG